jgi:hypothetical protein
VPAFDGLAAHLEPVPPVAPMIRRRMTNSAEVGRVIVVMPRVTSSF